MKKSMKKSLLCFALILVLISNLIPVSEISINASDSLVPVAIDNLDLSAVTNVKTATRLKRSYLVPNASGYMRVSFDNEHKKIWIEDYNDKFMITSKRSLDLELDLWGGFYAGDDAYYIAEGQNNTEENNNKSSVSLNMIITGKDLVLHPSKEIGLLLRILYVILLMLHPVT